MHFTMEFSQNFPIFLYYFLEFTGTLKLKPEALNFSASEICFFIITSDFFKFPLKLSFKKTFPI